MGDYRRDFGKSVEAARLDVMKLPNAKWHQRQSLKDLIAVLDGASGSVRFVGGAVRDTLLDIAVKDIDLATVLKPDMAR